MANNKSVKILRGTNANIYKHRNDILEDGQLLFNTDKGYITVGKNSNTKMNSLPVTVREVRGLFSDTSAISNSITGDNYYINDDNGQRLKIYSSKGIQLNGTSITLNVAPEISESIAANANTNKAVTSAWVRTASGNTSLNAASANKLNTNAGSNLKFVYFSNGVPVATTQTKGSGTKPVYMNSGVITESSSTVGSSTKPIYMNSGTLTASSNTIGGNTNPIYFNNGTVTASTATVGSSTRPIYFNNGTVTQTGDSLAVNIKGNADTATTTINANKISINGSYRTVSFSNGILSFS